MNGNRIRFLALGVTIVLAGSPAKAAEEDVVSPGSPVAAPRQWLASWVTAPQSAGEFSMDFGEGFENQTIRQIAHLSVGGSAVRIRLTNAFGKAPVRFASVFVGLQGSGAGIRPGSNRRVTFSGENAVTISPGAATVSDPVGLEVHAGQNLAISLFVPDATGPPTVHIFSMQFSFVSEAGDFSADEGDSAFPSSPSSWYFLSGIEVLASAAVRGSIVVLGDSISDGLGSDFDLNERWPDVLARRILAGPPGQTLSVLNQGITANRVLNNSSCFGAGAGARLDRDVLAQKDVRFVILFEGANDLGFPDVTPETSLAPLSCLEPRPPVTAADITEGYRQIIARAHAAGLKIFGATLLPFGGSAYATPETLAKREEINAWIRESRAFDGVIDFASVVADPRDPSRIAPAYDWGDALHLNNDGYEAMGRGVNLKLFR